MKQTAVEWLTEKLRVEFGFAFSNNILEQAKEMEKQQSFADVNRVEVIQHSPPYNGRVYTNYDAKDVELQLQDNNKTLKIFLK
jgi:hypothetical protein